MENMTPRQIVDELDRYIIGQADAKRAVAVAIRNRWRRRRLEGEIAREVYPKNIIMIGPTGVGKTEIARRLAKLASAPFIKIEASKFTEVGYHGRDVESMIRDLLEQAISMVRAEQAEKVTERATEAANDRLIDLLLPGSEPTFRSRATVSNSDGGESSSGYVPPEASQERRERIRERLREQLDAGKLDDREVEIVIQRKPNTGMMFANMGLDQMDPDMAGMLEKMMPEQSKRRKMKVTDARRVLAEEETEKLLDTEKITAEAIERTEQSGIIFLDEIDKVASGSGGGKGGGGGGGSPDVSRQGVQRDLLPIVEGSTVNTRHGMVKTDHILFVAAGAFHSAAVSDLMPELQGRFPIRVELSPLGKEEFVRILTEPGNALTRQQEALLGVEGLTVTFEDGAIEAMAELAADANASLENIGARRLMTIVEKVFEQVNFDAPDRVEAGDSQLKVTEEFVREQVASIVKDKDLSKFVL
ncbi:ATP-dependent protease ATPase subunit HslU [Phycisphaerales bacterium AB-hyl4]|uniref:ATP-dependent protease ATPase subunit HslU n=1 Tax=Natronomicrosphaera hydrolytica TaxID=3242702 RepID=A0ABV4U2P8_9BACT